MTAWEATSFYQWICSVSVGDIINLFFALGTISMAVLTFVLLRRQTQIIETQAQDGDSKQRIKMSKCVNNLLMAVLGCEGQLAKESDQYLTDNRHLISRLFDENTVNNIRDIRTLYLTYSLVMHSEIDADKREARLKEFAKKACSLDVV